MDISKMTELWADYVFEGRMSPEVRAPIAESWRKCRTAGLNPSGGEGRHIDANVLESARAANKLFLEIAIPVMRQVFDIIRASGFLIVLTDSAGYLLEMMGDEEIVSRSQDMRFVPGAMWSNLEVGTNAISVALDYDIPIQMVGPEHYCVTHHGWTCSAAPIHGPNGEVVGCINISGDIDKAHPHTLGMVQAAAIGIEGQIRQAYNAQMMNAALESSRDGILFLDQNREPFWMNSAAEALLKTDLEGLRRIGLESIVKSVGLENKDWKSGEPFVSDNTALHIGDETIYCSIVVNQLTEYDPAYSVTLRPQTQLISSVNKLSGNRAVFTFRSIITENDSMKKTLALAAKFARYEGNILIQGESGSGKEVLAQAIHNASRNADGPFVVVNCASIPRELFEMELFGYEASAFPGRAAEGKPGRFELADSGTLFLDEVSNMPLEIQQKLLRAVETHSIQRLGSTHPIQLDIRIIASTSQQLSRLAERDSFRRDMYFRLSSLKLDIPPLRERPEDIVLYAEYFLRGLNEISSDAPKSMTPEFLEGLRAYDWPGNVRELQNSIARAYYSSVGTTLTSENLVLSLERQEPEAPAAAPLLSNAGEGGIIAALTICNGDVDAAAERLGIGRATLYRRMKKYGIVPRLVRQKS
ncbi:MAG: sigma-54-dependent Fis family transcriptional regulator [Clostridia bacterium]|nr:sigma-54-dependent Fis family transcriptional regulator [Oscillospiraceae bacterium]MBO5568960.1 sigma-54-dependent Fis family transcriptional regulator [Clostridia bacterium]